MWSYNEVLFLSTVGSGTRWKFSAVCCVRVCHCRNGWGGTSTDWWQVAGRDTHQGVLLCSWPSWKKHVGCSDCCPNHGITKIYCFHVSKAAIEFALTLVLIACLVALSFKAVNRGKGLLPDPTALQILTGLSNPTTLKMLLNPLSTGHKQGEEFVLAVNVNQWFYLESVLLQCLMFWLFAGLLGAAPTMPLLANLPLSAALLQLLIQNQAKAQQVLLPLCLFSHMFLLAPKTVFNHFVLLIHTPFLLSAVSLFTISKPFWEIIFCGLRCCTIKKTL